MAIRKDFGEGYIEVPDLPDPPRLGDQYWDTYVASMVELHSPRRFAVLGIDPSTDDAAILAWGLAYEDEENGDADIRIESCDGQTRWYLTDPAHIHKYFPATPDREYVQILWVDGPDGLIHRYRHTGSL